MDFLLSNAYLSLFLLSFLAATIVPVGSEWLLVTLVLQELNPFLLVLFAGVGNVLGACTTYALGRWGSDYLITKILHVSPEKKKAAEQSYERYGAWSLLLSWVPVIGDPLCLIGGIFHVKVSLFLLLVSVGKFARYAFIAYITQVLLNG